MLEEFLSEVRVACFLMIIYLCDVTLINQLISFFLSYFGDGLVQNGALKNNNLYFGDGFFTI